MKIKNLGLLFKKIADENNEIACLNFGDGNEITYGEIDKLSDQFSLYLKTIGIKENDRISIESKKDIFSYVIFLSCLKLGIIYSFFDINDAKNRISHILSSVKPKKVFFFSKSQKHKIRKDSIIISDDFKKRIYSLKINFQNFKYKNKYFDAYIMFTSGSTGKPKGVLISHLNLIFFIKWIKKTFKIDRKTIMSNLNPLHFDNSVFDLYGSFFNVATLVPIEKNEILIPELLIKKFQLSNCKIWFSVPSLLDLILKIGGYQIFKKHKFKKIIFGGERFPLQSVKKIFPITKKTKFFNVSGPTECTCMCSSYELKSKDLKDKDVYVGKISNYFNYRIVRLPDEKNKKKKIGELYLEGPAVSSGYFQDKFKTREKFYTKGNTMWYKTGDIVYENKNKLLKIIGRVDNQIKFLGHRIELEEIEKVFIKKYKVKNCIAVLKNKKQYPFKKIVLILDKKIGNVEKIKKEISLFLPKYMIPEDINFVNKFNYNVNGKLDRTKY